jgi:Holliday junction resolvase RusA-like endonuclease
MSMFTVYGEPQGKARARTVRSGGKVHSFTPQKTADYEELVRRAWLASGETGYFNKTPIAVKILAYFQIPKSVSKKKREEMLDDFARPTKKPDADNIAKIICDGLNGIAYGDDAQVVDLEVTKYWTDGDARVEVTIWEV